jgi:hypothetical protein
MATKKEKRTTYRVMALLQMFVDVPVMAESLTDALEISKGLNDTDFITGVSGEEVDSTFQIISVGKEWPDIRA